MEIKQPLPGGSKLAQRLQQAESGAAAGATFQSTLADLESLKNEAFRAGGVKRIDDQHRRGKLTARERLELLLDEGSFEEFDILKTGRGDYTDRERRYPGDGVITGHGTIDGREVFVFARISP
jgi:propionyl-CoA carboxylase beta chain